MKTQVVIKGAVNCLIHVPDLVQYGSKPRREIEKNRSVLKKIKQSLRTFEEAVSYPPNQVFIGNTSSEELKKIKRPWYQRVSPRSEIGKFGRIVIQEEFYALLKSADVFGFFDTERKTKTESSLPIFNGRELFGYLSRDNRSHGSEDENLEAHHLLEGLCVKASGALAITELLHRTNVKLEDIDYVLSCGEEALGDRYQRGGGGIAKAMGEMGGCLNASGDDIKNFCAAPSSAIVLAGMSVKSGVFDNVIVVGGGSLSKLGMKFQSFVQERMPILDDCLGAFACLISKDDGVSPIVRIEKGAIGMLPISAGRKDILVYRNVITKPLKNLGLKVSDNDKIATELQNPEITEHSGAGDVAFENYRKIADEAVEEAIRVGELDEEDEDAINIFMESLIEKIGMPGFAPTQGHIPSAIPYLPCAIENIKKGRMRRVMFVGKASLFLNRMIDSLDARSFILEKNPKNRPKPRRGGQRRGNAKIRG